MTDATVHRPAGTCAAAREMPPEEALARILAAIEPVGATETIPLWNGHGRVLAEDLRSAINVPAHDNAAMDGYALRGSDLPAEGTARLTLVGRALAGHPFTGVVGTGQCVAITTGAPLPAGADTVIMVERTEAAGDTILIDVGTRTGANVRFAGEDVREGSLVAAAGACLNPALLGVLASLGIDRVVVYRRPRVALLSTGDEVQAPGTALRSGGVYDSNRYALNALLRSLGVDVIDCGAVPDDPQRLREALADAAGRGDVVVSSGGVSVGEADFVKAILAGLGTVDFWKLAIRPGRPLTFGTVGGAVFFGLPGNPVAVMVTFLAFVRPALQRLMGMPPTGLTRLEATCTDRLRKRPGRREFQRGIVQPSAGGGLQVRLTGRQGSGILTSMILANCLVVLPEDRATVEPGERVSIELLPWATIPAAGEDEEAVVAACDQPCGG
jgi:molybdopterin molybdotransferase